MKGPKLGFFRRLRCMMVAPFAPDFWARFPINNDDKGPWMVEAIVTGIAYSHVRRSELVKGGLWDAYIRARELAVGVDLATPHHPDGEVGVDWRIRFLHEG